jgi:hypothetical protein
MRVNSQNAADIRFFGAHDRAWIPIRDVYLYSAKPPAGGDAKRKQRGANNNLDTCFKEVEMHMTKLKNRFGRLDYAAHRTPYDPSREEAMLKILFPNYTLPFEIGTRRARTYSFTGSERSRDATPTPSEISCFEDEGEEEEEGEEEGEGGQKDQSGETVVGGADAKTTSILAGDGEKSSKEESAASEQAGKNDQVVYCLIYIFLY